MVLIDYKNVDIYHNDGDTVLRGVDFHVEEGEFIYLIGRVGAGKSSLLKTIYMEMDIERADSAMVLGYDLTTIRRKQIPCDPVQAGDPWELWDADTPESMEQIRKAYAAAKRF